MLRVQRKTRLLFHQDSSSSAFRSQQLLTRLQCRISVEACVTERSRTYIENSNSMIFLNI